MSLIVDQKKIGDVYTFHLSGNIDEESVFPDTGGLNGKMVIDLEGIGAINSVGIRSWLQWFSGFGDAEFTFKNCPVPIVMQMNMVEGFLPKNSRVESFLVPYYCEECDKEFREMFLVGRDIFVENGTFRLASENHVQCSKGCVPELDTTEAKYFRFLTKMMVPPVAA